MDDRTERMVLIARESYDDILDNFDSACRRGDLCSDQSAQSAKLIGERIANALKVDMLASEGSGAVPGRTINIYREELV